MILMNNSDSSIYSEKFKIEVDKAHKKFFEKRGIDPSNIPGVNDCRFEWWTKTSVQPKGQYPQAPSPHSYNEKQKNA